MSRQRNHAPSGWGDRPGSRVRAVVVVLGMTLATMVPAVAAMPAMAAVPVYPDGTPGASGRPAPAPAAAAPSNLPQISDAYGATPAENLAMQTAAATAQRTNTAVVVDSLTSETEQLVAQPGGGFAVNADVEPVRTRARGRWVGVDTRLHRNSAGVLVPGATAYGKVTLSGGGTGALATTVSGQTRFALSWPHALPKPVVSGSTATYPNVLPGVDLAASATVSGGFSEVLIVKNAKAALNPALARLRLAIGTSGAKPGAGAGGQALNVIDAKSRRVLQAAAPRMWDSNTDASATDDDLHASTTSKGSASTANPATALVRPDPSDRSHPGLVAREMFIPTTADAHALTLTPDRTLLRSPATVFPVYIDPTFNWHPTDGGTPGFDELKQGSPCNGVSLYGNDGSAGDYGLLGVGVNAWDGCQGTMRAYYQWKLSHVIWGAQINTATVNATEVYAASCSATSTIDLHQTGAIGSGTKWNNRPATGSFHTSASFAAAANSSCSSRDDVTHGFNVKSAIAKAASGHDSTFTVSLTEDAAESSRSSTGFKRFSKKPALQIFFNRTPATPGASALAANAGALNAGCDTVKPYPFIGKTIASNTTVLSAKISDPDADQLQVAFRYWIDGSATTATGYSGDNLASGSKAKFNLPATFTSALTNGQVVDWTVNVSDGQATSGWKSPTCQFVAQPTAPDPPSIVPADGNYPDTSIDGAAVGKPAGTPGTFTITNTGTTSATKFIYQIDLEPPATSPTADQTVAANNNAASVTITPVTPGPHTLNVYAVDAAGDSSPTQHFPFTAAAHADVTCASWTACLNNTAISPDTNPSAAAADGLASLSATDLSNAGWKSAGKVTVNGATFTLPTFSATKGDNILAANQTIPLTQDVPTTGATALSFLAFSTDAFNTNPGAVEGNTTAPYVPTGTKLAASYCFDATDLSAYCAPQGKITYSDGSVQPYDLLVPDWTEGPASLAAVTLPHENKPTGQVSNHQPKIYALSVPIAADFAGKTITSITLPDTSDHATSSHGQAIHVLAMATRNTTTTSAPVPAGETWTGAWASPNEGEFAPTTGANFSNQTFRTALRTSVSGNAIRVKLDNALGTSPLSIGHATVAAGSTNISGAATSPFTNLTFGGSTAVTIPEGGMVFSDPLPYTVTANTYLLVSFSLTNTVPYLVQHSLADNAHQWVTAAGAGDKTTDAPGTAFGGTGAFSGHYTDLVTNVDVATSGVPTQAVLGDGLVDAWQPNTTPSTRTDVRLSDVLAIAEPSTPSPFGTLGEGIESNYVMKDNPQTYQGGSMGGPAALSRIDRDILDQPGLNTVVLFEGLEDALNGATADDLNSNGYTELLTYLKANQVNVIAVGLPPCGGYTGDGATSGSTNDPCTTDVDANRTDVNTWLAGNPLNLGPWTSPALSYLDSDSLIGVLNTSTALTELDPNAAMSDKVNLTNAAHAALTSAYLGPQNTWQLDDGADSADGDTTSITTAADSATNASPYLANNLVVGTEPATLTTTGATWASDPTRGSVLALNGSTGAASTTAPALTTNASYSVSAWANLTSTTSTATVISQQGTNTSAFTLQYDKTNNAWAFTTTNADTSTATKYQAAATTAPTLNTWTHLVATYNATTHTMSLYINGALAATTTNTTPWNATGPVNLGSTATTNYFTGTLSNIQAWNYQLTPTQITALYQQIK